MTTFYVDENLSPDLAHSLGRIFRQHRFLTPAASGLLGVDDLNLFIDLASRGVECLITLDKMQLENPDERAGLRSAGLHWLGVATTTGAGVQIIASHLGMAAPAVAYVLQNWHPHPTAYRCDPGGSGPKMLPPEDL